MNRLGTALRRTAHHVREIVADIPPFIQNGQIRWAELEAVAARFHAPDDAVREVASMLRAAGIDLTDAPNWLESPTLEAPEPETTRGGDPVEAARALIKADARARRPEKRLLTALEEVGLALLIRGEAAPLGADVVFGELAGEARSAAEALFRHNLLLVHSVAQKHTQFGMDYEDVVQHGMLGLIRAVEKFDPSHGTKFSTYAVNWIRQAIARGIANESRIIRLPVHMFERVRKVWAVRDRLSDGGIHPGLAELAMACDLTEDDVINCLALGRVENVISSDLAVGEGETTLGDLLIVEDPSPGPLPALERAQFEAEIRNVLDTLSEREATIIAMRFGIPSGEPQTLEEIGKRFGLTRERIRQIEKKAMSKLRHPSRNESLRIYLGDGLS